MFCKAMVYINHETEAANHSTRMSNLYQIKFAEIWDI